MRLDPRTRIAVVALVAAVTLSACSGLPPLTALSPYAASDGLQMTVADVRGLNLLVVTKGEGQPAILTGTLINSGNAASTVTVGFDGQQFLVAVPAKSAVRMGPDGGDSTLVASSSAKAAGFIASVKFHAGAADTLAPVPIVDGTLPQYAAVLTSLDAWLAASA